MLADPLNRITCNKEPNTNLQEPNTEVCNNIFDPADGFCGGRGDQFVVETETAWEQAGSAAPVGLNRLNKKNQALK